MKVSCVPMVLQCLYNHGFKDAVICYSETINACVDVELFQGDKTVKLHPLTQSGGMTISW